MKEPAGLYHYLQRGIYRGGSISLTLLVEELRRECNRSRIETFVIVGLTWPTSNYYHLRLGN